MSAEPPNTSQLPVPAGHTKWDTIRTGVKIFLVIWIPLLLTVIVPGIVAYWGAAFDETGLICRVHQLADSPAKRKAEEYLSKKCALTKLSEGINERLLGTIDNRNRPSLLFCQNCTEKNRLYVPDSHIPSEPVVLPSTATELIQIRDRVEAALKALDEKPDVFLIPFYPRPYMFLYTPLFLALLVLLWFEAFQLIERSDCHKGITLGRNVWIGFLVYSPFLLSTVFRHWLTRYDLGNPEGRIVFAYANWDIWLPSLAIQEIIAFVICCLLVRCWNLWYESGLKVSDEMTPKVESIKSTADRRVNLVKQSELLSEAYIRWIACSVVLGIGFLAFTSFYWHLVQAYRDYRYVADAAIRHLLWGASWVLLSMPLYWRWRGWEQARLDAMLDVVGSPPNGGGEGLLKAIAELEPVGRLRFIAGGLAVAVAFVAPVFQLLSKM